MALLLKYKSYFQKKFFLPQEFRKGMEIKYEKLMTIGLLSTKFEK